MNNLSSEAHGKKNVMNLNSFTHIMMPKVWLLKVRFVPPLEKRLKNPFLDDDPFEQLGAAKTRFSATKPHFQPIYLRNFNRMK